jgi:aspartyl-tRNA synthetase
MARTAAHSNEESSNFSHNSFAFLTGISNKDHEKAERNQKEKASQSFDQLTFGVRVSTTSPRFYSSVLDRTAFASRLLFSI